MVTGSRQENASKQKAADDWRLPLIGDTPRLKDSLGRDD
jgi:hypothetical protein